MNKKEWLASLKPGDEVCVSLSWNDWHISKVERLTKTMIILNHGRFNRETGHEVGETIGFTPKSSIEQVTQERRDEIEKNGLVRKAKNIDYHKLSLDALRKIITLAEKDLNAS